MNILSNAFVSYERCSTISHLQSITYWRFQMIFMNSFDQRDNDIMFMFAIKSHIQYFSEFMLPLFLSHDISIMRYKSQFQIGYSIEDLSIYGDLYLQQMEQSWRCPNVFFEKIVDSSDFNASKWTPLLFLKWKRGQL